MSTIKLFETKQVRSLWDAEKESWFFSIVDVVAVLTDSIDAGAYWRKLKQRLKAEGNETVTNCHGLSIHEKLPTGFDERLKISQQGGTIAGNTSMAIEAKSGKPIISRRNAKKAQITAASS